MHKPNPFAIPQDVQSKVDEIMARSRSRFAGWTMEADPGATPPADLGTPDPNPDPDAALGDAGKQAIERMKVERKAAEARAKAAEAELEKLRNASKSEQEKAVDAARKEGESEATKRANDRLRKAEAKALAASAKFRDSGDVIAQLGSSLSEVPVDEDGEVDIKALKALVDDLAKNKPYLIDSGDGTASAADAGIGVTGSSGKPLPGTKAADIAQIEADLAAAGRRR